MSTGVSLSGADFKGSNSNDPTWLPERGDHLCEVRNIRMLAGHKGRKFFLDYTVIDGPSGKGYKAAYMVDLDNFYFGGQLTKQMAYAKELGKIGKAVAAVLGYKNCDASVVTDEAFENAVAQRPVSIFAKRLVVVRSVPYTKKAKDGKPAVESSFCEVHPISEWKGQLPAGYVDPTRAPAASDKPAPIEGKVAPKTPSLPAKKAEVFPPAPWKVHPEDPSYFWNEEDPNQEPLDEGDLRALLAAGN